MNDRIWYIKNCRLFERLSLEQLGRLERRARIRKFPKNTPIYFPSDEADSVLLLAQGRVKLCSYTEDGKQAILAFIEPGEVFGELSLLGEPQRNEHAETMQASTVVLLPGEVVTELMLESPQLSLGVTKLIGLRRRRIEQRLKSLLFRSNRERLVHLFLELAEQYGTSRPDGVHINIRLSHQDLASVIGTTRETMTVLIGELKSAGLVHVERQRYRIPDAERLANSVGTNAPAVSEKPPHGTRVDSAPAPLEEETSLRRNM